jgi:CO dehydrogenase/acetyl-CoA synthase gamma subunit (corrinoid Fe-S protein)
MLADLYLDRIDYTRYVSPQDCAQCGCSDCGEWLARLQEGSLKLGDCESLRPEVASCLELVLSLESVLPTVEVTQHPVQGILGCQEINSPGPDSPILVTGNALVTQLVITAVLTTTASPFYLLFVDCLGHTVDMALIYNAFGSKNLKAALAGSDLVTRVAHRELILPGVLAPIRENLELDTGWTIHLGPYCVGELPLHMADYWSPVGSRESRS